MGTTTGNEGILDLAARCMEQKHMERPEVVWLKERYGEFMRREGFSGKEAADRCLYERIYGIRPKRQDTLKIRYWRTGWHLPASYGLCAAFGRALRLDREEMRYLLQGYYDSCDRIYEEEPSDSRSAYWLRRKAMKDLTDRYLQSIPQNRLRQMRITERSLEHSMRHLYYTDALGYVYGGSGMAEKMKYMKRHITSVNYDSEFGRNMKLLGVIPRKTMIRHLLILGMPWVGLDWLNEQLRTFGYLELKEHHTLRDGERLDWLLIRILRRYEEYRQDRPAAECFRWMRECCCALDTFFEKEGRRQLRFMYFKALGE